ncbi:helix-turn-helix transcriptional regulator [Pseudazoarcus pumilus]|uniref:Helix-turn-helix domain-containing protein n=1 Tax=Pseudazoarcus pumilus TaxID=2067960 RepID=A0A2I6S6F1_9RHOO|nr:helix-turn-helix domain-containing protein [Pseudazoarcus pumilus]AUN94819.1 hypothetical protein C0099_07665 [Pseudazoarcus pumilus]
MTRYLSRKEAAAYLTERGLHYSHTTLQKLVTVGGGPAYRKFGNRAVYHPEDLDAWIDAKLTAPRYSSTR